MRPSHVIMCAQLEVDLDAPIAIVGIGCKVPGGKQGNLLGKDALWKVSWGESMYVNLY